MATSQHLYRKGDVFYARFRVPTRLLPVLDQRELRWSLQTSTLKTAQKHLLIASVLIREFFEQASMEIAHKPLTESEKIAIRAELEKLKFTKLAEFKALIGQGDSGIIEAQRLLTAEKPLIQAFVQAIDARSFDTPEVVGSSQELLPVVDRLAYDFSSKNPNFNFLANEYCSSMLLQHRAKAALLRHELNRDIATPTPTETMQPSVAQKTNGPCTTPISKVLDEYLADLEGKGLRGKSIQEYRGVLGKLVGFLSDRPIEDVRRSDLTSFRSALKRHPAYLSREQRALGVAVGADEASAGSRISHYEHGRHVPDIETAKRMASTLDVPLAYLYCEEERLAELLLVAHDLSASQQQQLIALAKQLKK